MDSSNNVLPADIEGWRGVKVTAPDGLSLFARDYGPRRSSELPVVCLPGLSRNSVDFHELAVALASEEVVPRRVVAIDYRGRGRSAYDHNAANYAVPNEVADVVAIVTALELSPALYVGTSRGGILAMLIATMRPAAVAGLVLNDIGPVIEPQGLMRIKSVVGKLPAPRSFEEGAEILQRLGGPHFPKLAANDWLRQARRTWTIRGNRLVPDYDVKLTKALDAVDLERPLPPLWQQFDALGRIPLMIIRGANSDILSTATVDAMRARHVDVDVLEVPDQGHAPLLVEPAVIRRIIGFFATCDSPALQ